MTCMLIDLDRFKQINDTYGHDTGDTALKQAAKILKNAARTQDIVSRIGGEEFMVTCPDTPLKEGVQYAELIRRAFEDSSDQCRSRPHKNQRQHRHRRVQPGHAAF